MIRYELRLVLLILLLFAAGGMAEAFDNGYCLGCHGERATERLGARLYIDPAEFAGTRHALIGCPSCHDSVTARHPADRVRPPRPRCGECHAPVVAQYGRSRHAGGAECTDCHDPHKARSNASSSGAQMNQVCSRCHERGRMAALHGRWLPQAELHMDALPCVTCHTASPGYTIDLYLEEKGATADRWLTVPPDRLRRLAGGEIAAVADGNGDGVVSLDELRSLNRFAEGKGMRLTAMLLPKVISHSFETLDNRWDCTFCHASGPRSDQESYLALPEPDGGFRKMRVERGAVLDLIYGTPDFYMLGSTRSKTLNIAGLLIILGGMMMPVGHGTFRLLTRNRRKEQ